MYKAFLALIVGIPLVALSGPSVSKGCLKGAAVGGVAGHVAGGHGVVGAAAGCAIEHHREKVADRKAAGAQRAASTPPAPSTQIVPAR